MKTTIVGNGSIARALQGLDLGDKLFFASGVPDSGEVRESEYQREIVLLLSQDHKRHLVYFSSLSIFYKDSRYAQHKKQMETLIKVRFPRYTIMRLGNPVWSTNPVHLIPFLTQKLARGEEIQVQDVYRYPLELEEFIHWVKMIPDWSCEMNITGKMMLVRDIITKYVEPLAKK